jgi:phenylalanyl-tRNA synthetase alpha chain
VYHHGEWIEIGEAGLASAGVLRRAGLDGSCSGLALGVGLDRLLMLTVSCGRKARQGRS